MTEKPTVYTSNQTQHLETLLRDNLFFKSRPLFEKKLVFLPHPSLKNPLLTSFVADGKLDVALGVDFLELGSGVSLLYQWTTGKTLLFPPQDLLTLHLEALLDAPHLAPALALEFLKYGKYGGAFLKQWKSGWQKTLWDQVTQKWNYPYEILDIPLKKPATKAEIHLFNFPFLPKLYHLFFAKLSKFFSISYYQFSPCKEFWSDTVSEVEKVRLLEKNPQLSLYLDEGHPLLKNLGRLGRETFRVFEEEDFAFEEHYQAPEPKTFLTHLQNDLLHFQKTTAPKDSSVLLLPAASKLREVEILYAKLLKMECPPSEIQVFAPEISSYAPLIELVFGSEESPFDFTIRDLPEHPLLQAFLDLLTLNEERFTPASLFKIFSSPYFFALSEKEVKAFQKWIDQSGVKWGVSPVHREKLLPGFHDTTPHGTWEEAFKQLLNHLLYLPVKPSEWDLPYLDFTDSVLLGKCIALIRSLYADLDQLAELTQTGREWCDHLILLFHRYLKASEEDLAPLQEKIFLLKELEMAYPFSNIKRYLQNHLKQKRGARFSKQLEAITFRSLKPGTLRSTQVIALLGMHEGAFPRPHLSSSLNLLQDSDYIPSTPDEDRYLFLEALCVARKSVLITYQNMSEEDGKEQPPSLVVQELDPLVEKHPPFPFHHSYFEVETPYSKKHFETATIFYGPKQSRPFIPEFSAPTPLPKPRGIETPSSEELVRFAKNPLRYYCNHTLNLYLHYEDSTDPEFFLSPLQKHRLLASEEALEEAEARGHLPLGRFQEVAKQRILQEASQEMEKIPFPEQIKRYPSALDSQEALRAYLEYYDIALQTPSPLHPHCAEALLCKDVKAFASRIKTMTDPYFKMLFKEADPEVVFETWAPFLRKVFHPLLEALHETV